MTDQTTRIRWPAPAGILAGVVGLLILTSWPNVSFFEAYVVAFGYAFVVIALVGLATGICTLVLTPAQLSPVISFAKWCLLATAIASMAWLLMRPGGVSGCSLEEDAAPILSALAEHRRREGHYPADLRRLGITIPDTPFGPWTYESDESSFRLTVGEYMEHGFVLEYQPDEGWYCDT